MIKIFAFWGASLLIQLSTLANKPNTLLIDWDYKVQCSPAFSVFRFHVRLQPGQINHAKTLFDPQKPNWVNAEEVDEVFIEKTDSAVKRQNCTHRLISVGFFSPPGVWGVQYFYLNLRCLASGENKTHDFCFPSKWWRHVTADLSFIWLQMAFSHHFFHSSIFYPTIKNSNKAVDEKKWDNKKNKTKPKNNCIKREEG